MIDRILALFALLTMTAFVGVVIFLVPHPDLILISTACVALAWIDFGRELRPGRRAGDNRRM